MIGRFFLKKNLQTSSQKHGWVPKKFMGHNLVSLQYYGFNPVSEGVSAGATRNRYVFFKLKKLRVVFFILKSRENSFSLWPARTHSSNVVRCSHARCACILWSCLPAFEGHPGMSINCMIQTLHCVQLSHWKFAKHLNIGMKYGTFGARIVHTKLFCLVREQFSELTHWILGA